MTDYVLADECCISRISMSTINYHSDVLGSMRLTTDSGGKVASPITTNHSVKITEHPPGRRPKNSQASLSAKRKLYYESVPERSEHWTPRYEYRSTGGLSWKIFVKTNIVLLNEESSRHYS